MALYKPAEFARICAISPKNFFTYKSRKKVVVNVDGLVDDSDPLNVQFKQMCEENAKKRAAKGIESPQVSSEKTAKMKEFPGKTPEDEDKKERKANNDAFNAKVHDKINVETDLKRKQSELKDMEARMLKMKEQKMLGQLLPTDMIKPLFQTHFQSLTIEFQHLINAMITDVSVKIKLDRNTQAELRRKAVTDLNLAIEKAIFHTQRGIDQLIHDNAA